MAQDLLIPGLLAAAWPAERPRIRQLMESPYGTWLLQAYSALDTSLLYRSGIHGQGHIERVMLLGAMVAQGLSLPAADTEVLLFCCSYHDIGRVNDWLDDCHGGRSAELLLQPALKERLAAFTETEIRVMQAVIAAHSLYDGAMEKTGDAYEVGEDQRGRYLLLARCLKDADNLDRVRLGDLDMRYLRSDVSRSLAEEAEWIYRAYLRVKEARQ